MREDCLISLTSQVWQWRTPASLWLATPVRTGPSPSSGGETAWCVECTPPAWTVTAPTLRTSSPGSGGWRGCRGTPPWSSSGYQAFKPTRVACGTSPWPSTPRGEPGQRRTPGCWSPPSLTGPLWACQVPGTLHSEPTQGAGRQYLKTCFNQNERKLLRPSSELFFNRTETKSYQNCILIPLSSSNKHSTHLV